VYFFFGELDGQCARRAIAEAKHRSQWPVLGWVTKNLSQHDEKHVVPTPLSGLRVGGRVYFSFLYASIKILCTTVSVLMAR
jgi:hypothetical protein